ncbi:DUF1295 domain-containing protein [Kangiella sp. TOML190]|uniref:DUF1295 domain-containing protein n=1 Tax=Kangiella sp. TOML190 TaxID=2931351 RepID=UPI0020420B94|nr:DUF1295 domain-containing protein [Kangiella sp. TOML190]
MLELIVSSLNLLVVVALIQLVAWLFQLVYKNADPVDIAWSLALAMLGFYYIVRAWNNQSLDHITLVALCLAPVAWYSRLALHLINRFSTHHEDGRYAYLRKYWQQQSSSTTVQVKFLLFFLLQALLAWFCSLPALIISQQKETLTLLDILAIGLILVSFVGVSIADKQLLNFKKNHKRQAKVCDHGLWRYSRHPNYFFEWLHWCSYPLLAWHSNALATTSWWFIASFPLWMFLFLWKVTGIPFNEQQNIRSKGQAYRDYQERTNAFFPGKPNRK